MIEPSIIVKNEHTLHFKKEKACLFLTKQLYMFRDQKDRVNIKA